MTPTFFDSLKAYVGFTEQSTAALRELHPLAQPSFVAIVDDFYAAIEAHPGARAAITGGDAQIARLKQTLLRWIDLLLLGPHDEAYYEVRARIGRVHVRIALPQQYMFTAMDRIRVRLLDVLHRHVSDRESARRVGTALNQIIDLELAIMLETYREDLVERNRAAERLATELRHREVVESIPAFVTALDDQGRILTWNRPLETTTGYLRTEMLGTDGRELIGGGNDPRSLPVKEGPPRKVRWNRAEIQNTDGSRTLYAVGIDVTDEQEMLRRLLRSERLAAVGTMAAGLAHEVRNPLNSASLQLSVLERRLARGGTAADALLTTEIIKTEIDRLDRLVRDFLAFSQPRAPDVKPVDVDALLSSLNAFIAPSAENGGVTLRNEIATGLPPIAGDSERLRQVLLNLTRNALEAMQGTQSGVLTLRARSDGDAVEIDIEDNGPGFPEELPVFDAFFTTKDQGTGLGLSLVHRIVTDHGGTVRVESRPGRTCFTLRLPATT